MEKIIIDEETIAAYRTILQNPSQYHADFNFIPLSDFFIPSETITAQHILAQQYISHINLCLPKLILYIIMNELFGNPNGKDADGNLGYYLKSKSHEINSSTTDDKI